MPFVCNRCDPNKPTEVYKLVSREAVETAYFSADDEDCEDPVDYGDTDYGDCTNEDGPFCRECGRQSELEFISDEELAERNKDEDDEDEDNPGQLELFK